MNNSIYVSISCWDHFCYGFFAADTIFNKVDELTQQKKCSLFSKGNLFQLNDNNKRNTHTLYSVTYWVNCANPTAFIQFFKWNVVILIVNLLIVVVASKSILFWIIEWTKNTQNFTLLFTLFAFSNHINKSNINILLVFIDV